MGGSTGWKKERGKKKKKGKKEESTSRKIHLLSPLACFLVFLDSGILSSFY